MATNALPVYGTQFIRFAETFEAASATEAGAQDVVSIGEYCVVAPAYYAGSGAYCAPPSAFITPPTAIVGVNQALIPSVKESPNSARQATVANSGLLLVIQDPAKPFEASDAGSPLAVNGAGQASKGGTPVTFNGSEVTIRQINNIGSRNFVLVSFS